MGFELSRLLRLGNKVLPKEIKRLLVHKDVVSGVENVRNLLWDDDAIIEFWMDGFNDEGLRYAFACIVELYDQILHEDEQWHYFYEDHYSLIRCSYKFARKVEKWLDKNDISHRPMTGWSEHVYVTNE